MSEETTQTPPLSLADTPAKIATYLKSAATEDTPNKFADFISKMDMTDFSDVYQIRAIFESQAQMLGATFQYLMAEGDWRNLPLALRAQKMMLTTIDTMNGYPSEAFRRDLQSASIPQSDA